MKILSIGGMILFESKHKTVKATIIAAIRASANLRGANLRGANLGGANLGGADLRYADLRYADLWGADLWGADLWDANLRDANLRDANLRGANLRGADLGGADLRYADLGGADLDFSVLPLWCGSFGFKADIRLAAQLAYHFCRIDFGRSKMARAAQIALKPLANKFHRVKECGRIK